MVWSVAHRGAALVAGCLLALSFAVPAQTRQLLNYEAIHKPEAGTAGMVVSQNEAASRAGAQVLRDGGNAVDAAVATAFVLAVTLPRAGNIGGDGFMLVHLADEDRYTAIDYRSAAPELATLDATWVMTAASTVIPPASAARACQARWPGSRWLMKSTGACHGNGCWNRQLKWLRRASY